MKKYEFRWEGIPPKSTFQQRDKNFHKTANARLAMAQWLIMNMAKMKLLGSLMLMKSKRSR